MSTTRTLAMVMAFAVFAPLLVHAQVAPPDSAKRAPTPTVFSQPRRTDRVLLAPRSASNVSSIRRLLPTVRPLAVRTPTPTLAAASRIAATTIVAPSRTVARASTPAPKRDAASSSVGTSFQSAGDVKSPLVAAAPPPLQHQEKATPQVASSPASSTASSPASSPAATPQFTKVSTATPPAATQAAVSHSTTTPPAAAPPAAAPPAAAPPAAAPAAAKAIAAESRKATPTAESSADATRSSSRQSASAAGATTSVAQTSTARATAVTAVASQPPVTAPATSAPSATSQTPGWAHITYISGPQIYLDVGTKGGLREGSRLEVVRGASVIAELTVAYVSSSRSSCTVVTQTSQVVVGDSARFRPVQEVLAQVKAAEDRRTGADVPRATRRTSSPIRGRIGVRYLTMQQGGGDVTSTITQPAFDLRLDGHHINGTPFGLTVDVRAYRQSFARTSGTTLTSSTRAYQTALLWNPVNSGARVALGRQFSTALSTIGLFDGLSVDLDHPRWSVGALSGSQPDPRSFGYSGDVREHGAYFQLHNAPNAGSSWAMTLGGIGSYNRGQIDREFAYLQGTFNSRYVSVYTAQEVDVNRGWKSTVEGGGATPTSTFAMLRISPNDALSLNAGYDNRRSVRLYRDFINPEVAFDDSFRQGAWGGASLYVFGHLRVNADARTSKGGIAGTADSYTGSVQVSRLTPLQLGAQLRSTSYTGLLASGTLGAASIEMQPAGNLRISFNAGQRSDTRAATDVANSSTTWWGADADIGIGRSLYLLASTYRETGDFQRNLQTMLALSYRW